MEILKVLLNLFTTEEEIKKLTPLLTLLEENGYDLKKTLSSLKIETVAPIIRDLIIKWQNKRPSESDGQIYGLSPITVIANKKILQSFTSYFE